MKSVIISVAFGLMMFVSDGLAQQKAKPVPAQRGTLKAIDPDKGTVKITSSGKDHEFRILPQTQIQDITGQPAQGGLKHAGFKPGATVMFRPREQDGKPVLGGLKLATSGAQDPGQ